MKLNKPSIWCLVIAVILLSPLLNLVQANAASYVTNNSSYPPACTDPSKALVADPLDNAANPDSPNYDPSAVYGPPGTRFGPPGQKSDDSPSKNGERVLDSDPGHRWFGTAIFQNSILYVIAHHYFYNSMNIPQGGTLYAPTLKAPDYSQLEITTMYYWDGGQIRRGIGVNDHYYGSFKYVLLSGDYGFSNYIDQNGDYYCEILHYQGVWYAMMYNVSQSQWVTWWSQSASGNDSYGWDLWEEWSFNESPWPSSPGYCNAHDIKVYSSGSEHSITYPTYGMGLSEQGSAPYTFHWVYSYHYWEVY